MFQIITLVLFIIYCTVPCLRGVIILFVCLIGVWYYIWGCENTWKTHYERTIMRGKGIKKQHKNHKKHKSSIKMA